MATAIPEGRAFAAALERHLANGGGMRKGGGSRKAGFRFTKGKAKGLTVEEATQQARDLWDQASPAVREKYGRRAGAGLLAPSERMAAPERPPGVPLPPEQAATPVPGDRAANGRRFREELGLPPEPVAKPQATPGREFGASVSVPDASTSIRSTDRPVNPGVVAAPVEKAWVGSPSDRSPEMKAALQRPAKYSGESISDPGRMMVSPSRSQMIAAGAIERPAARGRLGGVPTTDDIRYGENPGKGWTLVGMKGGQQKWARGGDIDALSQSAATATAATSESSKPTGYAGPKRPGGRFDPDLGYVPTAIPVAEKPMTQAEYTAAGTAIKETMEPGSPEMSAALGRRRTFEDDRRKEAAEAARRERLGPSAAERDASHRAGLRRIQQQAGYGRIS